MIHLNITFPANVATALPLKLSFAIERRTSNSPDAHYALHGGPEPARHFADVHVSKHDEVDTYEAAFCNCSPCIPADSSRSGRKPEVSLRVE